MQASLVPTALPAIQQTEPEELATPAPRAAVEAAAEPLRRNPAPVVAASAEATKIAPPHSVHSGWIVQVGAFDAVDEAKVRLASAQNAAKKFLSKADPFTEPVVKGEKTLYRARFAGLEKGQAEAACKYLKRNDIACMAIRN
jgi:D-alanyl-D-alanine carboxypeptidase